MGGHWCLKLYSMGQEGEAKLFYFPQFGNSFSFFFSLLQSTGKCLVCALCITAVLATSA